MGRSPPSVPDFQRAVEQAFAAWEAIDPDTGLGTKLRFVPDFETPVFAEPIPPDLTGLFRLNHGAEIDILTEQHPSGSNAAVELFGDPSANSVALTSGVSNYAAGVISGADIYMTDRRPWSSIRHFQYTLTHEIGHAIGLGDVDWYQGARGGVLSRFYDDNYDKTSPATALDTLTNSFADLIDPLDPDNSPALSPYDICTPSDPDDNPNDPSSCVGNPGIDTPGVDILMESTPTSLPAPLGPQNDDFAGRQFLYPFVRVPGDFNGDTLLSVQDIDLLSAENGASKPRSWFDVNSDGSVDADDRRFWITDLKETFFGDTDLDGQVSAADLNTLALNWRVTDAISWAQGDFNGDGNVNASDLNDLALNWRSGMATAASAVPEPSSAVLLLLLLGGALMLNRHRRREA